MLSCQLTTSWSTCSAAILTQFCVQKWIDFFHLFRVCAGATMHVASRMTTSRRKLLPSIFLAHWRTVREKRERGSPRLNPQASAPLSRRMQGLPCFELLSRGGRYVDAREGWAGTLPFFACHRSAGYGIHLEMTGLNKGSRTVLCVFVTCETAYCRYFGRNFSISPHLRGPGNIRRSKLIFFCVSVCV